MVATPEMNFVVLYVDDVDKSLPYFTETLGLHHIPEASTSFFKAFGPDIRNLSFGISTPLDETRQAGQVELYFDVKELEQLREIITSRGGHATPITKPYFGSVFTVDAPNGHVLTMLRRERAQ